MHGTNAKIKYDMVMKNGKLFGRIAEKGRVDSQSV
jgi:hypothetical protein